MDDLLDRLGVDYNELSRDEKETYFRLAEAARQNALTIEIIREAIESMKDVVEEELCSAKYDSKRDLLLKGRLQNYRLLSIVLARPEKAKKALEVSLSRVASGRG